MSGYDFVLNSVEGVRGPNYVAQIGQVDVSRNGQAVASLSPETRVYLVQRMPTTEAAIDMGLTRDVYVVLGEKQESGDGYAVRTYIKPFANWIWIGAIVMSLGGTLSLTDRRFRVGATRRPQMAAKAAVPAE